MRKRLQQQDVPESDTANAAVNALVCILKGAEVGDDFGRDFSLAVIRDARERFPENAGIAEVAETIGALFGEGMT